MPRGASQSLTIEPPAAAAPRGRPAARLAGRLSRAAWSRVALALAFLGIAAGARAWQARQVADYLRVGTASPFPLQNVPLVLGDWKGQEAQLDPQVAQNTGCTDYISRIYLDERTGVRLSVIVLYGPPIEVSEHSPENCYPRSGFTQLGEPEVRLVRLGSKGEETVPFHALVFAKGEGGSSERREVYYTWRYGGRWTPVRALTKQIERIPGMYKIHVDRLVAPGETLDVSNPCESFLQALIPELKQRIAQASRPA